MSIYLEITQLDNGDIVLREAEVEEPPQTGTADVQTVAVQPSPVQQSTKQSREPLVRIRFSAEVKDMLGGELVGVAEAMIDAATDFLGGDGIELDPPAETAPTIH